MDSTNTSDLQAFYTQASFYRKNNQEKQYIVDELNKEIVKKRDNCKEIEEKIIDPVSQDQNTVHELNQERQSLANLYVKKLILTSEEAPFTAFYSLNRYQTLEETEKEESEDMSHHHHHHHHHHNHHHEEEEDLHHHDHHQHGHHIHQHNHQHVEHQTPYFDSSINHLQEELHHHHNQHAHEQYHQPYQIPQHGDHHFHGHHQDQQEINQIYQEGHNYDIPYQQHEYQEYIPEQRVGFTNESSRNDYGYHQIGIIPEAEQNIGFHDQGYSQMNNQVAYQEMYESATPMNIQYYDMYDESTQQEYQDYDHNYQQVDDDQMYSEQGVYSTEEYPVNATMNFDKMILNQYLIDTTDSIIRGAYQQYNLQQTPTTYQLRRSSEMETLYEEGQQLPTIAVDNTYQQSYSAPHFTDYTSEEVTDIRTEDYPHTLSDDKFYLEDIQEHEEGSNVKSVTATSENVLMRLNEFEHQNLAHMIEIKEEKQQIENNETSETDKTNPEIWRNIHINTLRTIPREFEKDHHNSDIPDDQPTVSEIILMKSQELEKHELELESLRNEASVSEESHHNNSENYKDTKGLISETKITEESTIHPYQTSSVEKNKSDDLITTKMTKLVIDTSSTAYESRANIAERIVSPTEWREPEIIEVGAVSFDKDVTYDSSLDDEEKIENITATENQLKEDLGKWLENTNTAEVEPEENRSDMPSRDEEKDDDDEWVHEPEVTIYHTEKIEPDNVWYQTYVKKQYSSPLSTRFNVDQNNTALESSSNIQESSRYFDDSNQYSRTDEIRTSSSTQYHDGSIQEERQDSSITHDVPEISLSPSENASPNTDDEYEMVSKESKSETSSRDEQTSYQSETIFKKTIVKTASKSEKTIDNDDFMIHNMKNQSPSTRIYNNYQDDNIIPQVEEARPSSASPNKIKVSYGSGYDYFKEIERVTLKEERRISPIASIRASTDRGWQSPESSGNRSPMTPFRDSPSPFSRNRQFEPTPECRIPQPIRTPSPEVRNVRPSFNSNVEESSVPFSPNKYEDIIESNDVHAEPMLAKDEARKYTILKEEEHLAKASNDAHQTNDNEAKPKHIDDKDVEKERLTNEWRRNMTIERKQHVEYLGKSLPQRRYEPRIRPDARNEKIPFWRQPSDNIVDNHPDHTHVADLDVHQLLLADEEEKEKKMKDLNPSLFKLTRTSGTIYSTMRQSSESPDEHAQQDEIKQAVQKAAENKSLSVRIPPSPVSITPPSTPVTTDPPHQGGLFPKMPRSVFKNLERTVVEEEKMSHPSQHELEKSELEKKKMIAENSLRYPGRRPKGGIHFTDETNPSNRKYFVQTNEPKQVSFSRIKTSDDTTYNHSSEDVGSKEDETVLKQSVNFTANNQEKRDKTPSKGVKFSTDVEEVEDFRNSRTFVHFTEGRTQREEEAKEKLAQFEKESVEVTLQEKQSEVQTEAKPTPKPRYQRPPPKQPEPVVEPKFIFSLLKPPIINSSNNKYTIMPELEDGVINDATVEMLKQEEGDVVKNWDPSELLKSLYKVDYSPRIEQKRSKFRNMEGHLEIPNDDVTVPEIDKEWKKVYFRTKDSRFQWFASKYADEHPTGDLSLTDAEIIPNKDDFTITVKTKKEPKETKIVVRVPSHLFEKWRQSLLSHRDSNVMDSYIQPFTPPIQHFTEKVVIIELGSASVRGGILTNKPSLPQSFFPSIGCVTADGNVFVGIDALKPEIRHNGELMRPFDTSDNAVERYKLNKEIFNASIQKVVKDLEINPSQYTVLLSIPQNLPSVFTSELLNLLLEVNGFKAATIAKQPSLILYSYDVTTGIVVDIGERLNIYPVIDEYIVENAIVSLPFGAHQIRDSLRKSLQKGNNGLYSYQSPVEHTLLRYVVEQACYVAADFDDEDQRSEKSKKQIDLNAFNLTSGMDKQLNIDESQYHATEGLFQPKKWNLELKGLHHLIHNAILLSPIDSRRTLYKNIYLSGGTSLLHGMAERIENEISKLVPGSIQVKVHMSPWRYHAAYLGAQVIASGKLFNKCCATKDNLAEYLKALEISTYCNGS